MNVKGLVQWLKSNSSGVYRPAAEAAFILEDFNNELNGIKAELRNYELNGSDSIKQIRDMYVDFDSTTKKLLDSRMENQRLRERLEIVNKVLRPVPVFKDVVDLNDRALKGDA